MSFTKDKKIVIRKYIIENVGKHPKDIVTRTAEKFGVTRPTIHSYIKKMIAEDIFESEGKGKGTTYRLKETRQEFILKVTSEMAEDKVWREKVKPLLPEITDNVDQICFYGFTEMLNNVKDHSESKKATIYVVTDVLNILIVIIDSGIGIFKKIEKDFDLESPKHAILELAKGKLTSNPKSHSGEGIFFTSRMFDNFAILSEKLYFTSRHNQDWLLEQNHTTNGTTVYMKIRKNSSRKMLALFDEYAGKDSGGFSKTFVPVTLVQYEGETLVSRSQAKRLLARFDRFTEVVLDFKGIMMIGQAFADEVFRVFKLQHPAVHLHSINTNKAVEKMIEHVLYTE